MALTNDQARALVLNGLEVARRTLAAMTDASAEEIHDEHVTDISTKADMAMAKTLSEYFQKQNIPARLISEELGEQKTDDDPLYTITWDEIDGTMNYHRGRNILQYCTVITLFDTSAPKFKDVLAAGILEHNSGKVWHAVRGNGTYLDGKRVDTSGKTSLDRKTTLIVDHYIAAEGIAKLVDIYPASWVKDFGTTAFHLAGVSSGLFDGFITTKQKAHELGAGYLLIKEANGCILTQDGKPLDDLDYDFNATYKVMMASTKELFDEISLLIKK